MTFHQISPNRTKVRDYLCVPEMNPTQEVGIQPVVIPSVHNIFVTENEFYTPTMINFGGGVCIKVIKSLHVQVY